MSIEYDLVAYSADCILVVGGIRIVADWFAAFVASVELVDFADAGRNGVVIHTRPEKPPERGDCDAR